jgi:hypothetical protein
MLNNFVRKFVSTVCCVLQRIELKFTKIWLQSLGPEELKVVKKKKEKTILRKIILFGSYFNFNS